MKHVKSKATVALGLAAGYVLGSRAGRERYEQIKSTATGVWKNPRVQDTVHAAEQAAQETAENVANTVKHKTQGVDDGTTSENIGPTPTNLA